MIRFRRPRGNPSPPPAFRKYIALILALSVASVACSDDDDDDVITPPPVDNAPTITLTAPNGGTAYEPGASVDVTWTATDDNGVTGVDLTYTADGIAAPVSISTGETGTSFSWTVPSETLYGVRVQATARDVANHTASDASDDMFAIIHASARGYVTSVGCADCHEQNYDDVVASGHPYKMNKVVGGVPPTYPYSEVPNTPVGFTWDDISWVIGGYGYKARFIDQEGYILVTGVTGVDVQYNIPRPDITEDGLPAAWTTYHSSDTEPKPYTCGACHTTGWQSLEDNGGLHQDDLPGMAGTWEEPGVWCEACHGPGLDHVVSQDSDDITVDESAEQCGSCHFRDSQHRIEASGGFNRHHEQYDELISAGMSVLDCGDCHDPHTGVRYGHAEEGGITATCESCHEDNTSNAHLVPVDCVTCHMSRATKSARAVNTFQGDVRSHIFAINSDEVAKDAMFYEEDGKTFTNGFVTLDMVCYQCHTDPISGEGGSKSEKSLEMLADKASGIHN